MGELNIKSTTIEKTIEAATGFLQKLVGPTVEEMGLLFADGVKAWRLNNQVKSLTKVQEKLKMAGIKAKVINPKVLFPYLEAVSLEDDEKLHELWANLITNYIDPDKNLEITVYPEILRQLSSKDIEILESIYSGETYTDTLGLLIPAPERELKYSVVETANLERLGITIGKPIRVPDNEGPAFMRGMEFPGPIAITVFGDGFYKACQRNIS